MADEGEVSFGEDSYDEGSSGDVTIDPRFADYHGSVLAAGNRTYNCSAPGCSAPATPNGYCFTHANYAGAQASATTAQACVEDLFEFERQYGECLDNIIKGFVLRLTKLGELGRPVVVRSEIDAMFLNVRDIAELHRKIRGPLEMLRFERKLLSPELPKVYGTFVPFLKLYQFYVNNYGQAEKKMITLRQQRDPFGFFMNLSEACEGQKIFEFMIQPVQYLPALLTKLHDLFLALDSLHPMRHNLLDLTQKLDALAESINISFRENEARQRVVQIQALLEPSKLGVVDIVTPHRTHVLDGPLEKQFNNKSMHLFAWKKYWFFLFNDLLMYTTVPSAKGKCKVKYQLPLVNMEVKEADAGRKRFGFEIKSSVKSFFLAASSPQEREKWIQSMSDHIVMTQKKRATLKIASPPPSPSVTDMTSPVSSPPLNRQASGNGSQFGNRRPSGSQLDLNRLSSGSQIEINAPPSLLSQTSLGPPPTGRLPLGRTPSSPTVALPHPPTQPEQRPTSGQQSPSLVSTAKPPSPSPKPPLISACSSQTTPVPARGPPPPSPSGRPRPPAPNRSGSDKPPPRKPSANFSRPMTEASAADLLSIAEDTCSFR
eukprot:gb/GEZN01003898.1/.p1 GENE.gb/GEZN01003898.1/~~gb/GEZN01003898.1/.p1  ORF type:complete len:600 (-),score=59.67 gb/GEZN01003898.1/:237-2036(-)